MKRFLTVLIIFWAGMLLWWLSFSLKPQPPVTITTYDASGNVQEQWDDIKSYRRTDTGIIFKDGGKQITIENVPMTVQEN